MSTRRLDSKLANAIKAEYISGNTDVGALARKYNVKESTLKARIYREDWDSMSDDEVVTELLKTPRKQLIPKMKELKVQVKDIDKAVDGLAKLDVDLQKQAQHILDLSNLKLDIECSTHELREILEINLKIRETYFNSKNASVVVNNNTAISNTSLSFFNGARKNEI